MYKSVTKELFFGTFGLSETESTVVRTRPPVLKFLWALSTIVFGDILTLVPFGRHLICFTVLILSI